MESFSESIPFVFSINVDFLGHKTTTTSKRFLPRITDIEMIGSVLLLLTDFIDYVWTVVLLETIDMITDP